MLLLVGFSLDIGSLFKACSSWIRFVTTASANQQYKATPKQGRMQEQNCPFTVLHHLPGHSYNYVYGYRVLYSLFCP